MYVGQGTVDVTTVLNFTDMRVGDMDAVTTPPTVSAKGHAAAIMQTIKGKQVACYPWDTNGVGFNTTNPGIYKLATIRGVFGPDWDALVTNERMMQGVEIGPDGKPIPYKGGAIVNGSVWVCNGAGERLAFKTNGREDTLYATCVIVESIGYEYRLHDGTLVPAAVVNPFIRPKNDAGRTGLKRPLCYRDYRADHVVGLRIGTAIADGDAKDLWDALKNDGIHPATGKTAREIAAAFAPPAVGTAVR